MGKWISSLLIVTVVVSGFVSAGAAQSVDDSYWMLNLRGGASHSDFTGGEQFVNSRSARTGLAFMLSAELVLNENVSWDFGFGLKQKGAEGEFNASAALDPNNPDTELEFDGDIKLGYVTFDTAVNGGMPIGYNGWLGLFGGVGVGFLVNQQAIGTLDDQPAELDLEKALHGQDYYALFGARYRYRYNNGITLLIDYRLELGMGSVDKSALDSGARTYSNIFTIGIGIPILTEKEG